MYKLLPVEPLLGMTSAERADAINAETWHLTRPAQYIEPDEITRVYFTQVVHPDTGQVAIHINTEQSVYINHDVDLTELLALLPEVPQAERDGLVMFIEANKGGSVLFGQLIPSTSTQLTEGEAISLGWFADIEP
jgi:hypothetical protein